MDLFDKCYAFTRADEIKALDMYPYFTPIQEVIGYGERPTRRGLVFMDAPPPGTENLTALIKTYFNCGGTQVQFNMVDSAILREAQRHPEKHRDLFVRVSGYSAEFIGLSEIAQEEIISRTEFEMRPG